MTTKTLERFALPGLGAILLASAVLATADAGDHINAYGDGLSSLEAETLTGHAAATFERADLDDDGVLSQNEYTALTVVTAELAVLNGFIALEVDGQFRTISVPASDNAASSFERTRIEAIASRQFHVASGADLAITKDEYIAFELERFLSADRNRNGTLDRAELAQFAAGTAKIKPVSA